MAYSLILDRHAGTGLPETSADGTLRIGRSCRVTCLLAGVVLMSLLDLHHTLLYLQTVGMAELNPLARWIIGFNSPAMLSGWKMLTVGVACGAIMIARHTRLGEFGAWVAFLILAALTVRWWMYSELMLTMPVLDFTQLVGTNPRWVVMTRS